MRKLIITAALAIVLGGAGFWYWKASARPLTNFRTAPVLIGSLKSTITATGTLEPEEVVDIGAQVAGRVQSLGVDPADPNKYINWGSAVEGPVLDKDGKMIKDGTVLAQIDPAIYQAQFDSTFADWEKAKADWFQKEAKFEQAFADWERTKELKKTESLTQAEFDGFKANEATTWADLGVSDAQIRSAKAAHALAKTNLEYTTITAPVSGVIIDRRVNIGQTVVASLSAPSLFLLAKDLSKMEVWATVNEVDVGKTRVGQDVTFTLDSDPKTEYKGKVKSQGNFPARLNASMNQNVVTYTVVVSADNTDGKLWPYKTANLTFIDEEKDNVLLVPNAALRWQPTRSQIDPASRDDYAKMKGKKKGGADGSNRGIVWVKTEEGFVRPLLVKTGLNDGVSTEIEKVLKGGDLHEGTEVVVGEGRSQVDSDGSNPFLPKMPFGGKKKEKES